MYPGQIDIVHVIISKVKLIMTNSRRKPLFISSTNKIKTEFRT